MADDENLLFVRGSHKIDHTESTENVWDDSVLIKAYDKAVSLAKDEVAKRLSLETDSSRMKNIKSQSPMPSGVKSNYLKKKWTVGSPCRAIYSVDGKPYEAVISKILKDSASCIVKFVGYGNIEKVNLSSLEESDGLESQITQHKDSLASTAYTDNDGAKNSHVNHEPSNSNEFIDERMDYESEIPKYQKKNLSSSLPFNSSFNMMPPAPPLPPQLIARLPESDDDALSSMLMSWYISGFHTGYYHGIKQAENNKNSRKKC